MRIGSGVATGPGAVERAVGAVDQGFEANPLNYWNAVGAWSAMALAMRLVSSAHAERRVTRALALTALAAYLTYPRAAVAGGALVRAR